MSLMMTVSQMTREGHHGQVGGRAPATLAVNRGLFLGAPRPVEGHRRQWPSWPSIISYPAIFINSLNTIIMPTLVLLTESEHFGRKSAHNRPTKSGPLIFGSKCNKDWIPTTSKFVPCFMLQMLVDTVLQKLH